MHELFIAEVCSDNVDALAVSASCLAHREGLRAVEGPRSRSSRWSSARGRVEEPHHPRHLGAVCVRLSAGNTKSDCGLGFPLRLLLQPHGTVHPRGSRFVTDRIPSRTTSGSQPIRHPLSARWCCVGGRFTRSGDTRAESRITDVASLAPVRAAIFQATPAAQPRVRTGES